MVIYEMQWSARYFMYMSNKWRDEMTPRAELSAGARAYAERKRGTWMRIAFEADKDFRANNVDYVSPF